MDSEERLFANHMKKNRIQIHLVLSARDPLPLEEFSLPCAIAISTNPENDDRLADRRGPKRLEESRMGDWLIYLLRDVLRNS